MKEKENERKDITKTQVKEKKKRLQNEQIKTPKYIKIKSEDKTSKKK